MVRFIDLRSDTVTLPTQDMRVAMYRAEVGDDGYGEDATVNRLQELAAERTGKEAALFVPTGTMGNLICLLTHCGRGDEVIMGHLAHILLWEGGGAAALGGLQVRTIPNLPNGVLAPEAVKSAIRSSSYPSRTGLICLENTHNRCGGTVLTAEQTKAIVDIGHRYRVPIHLDGARIFNAALELGVEVAELTADVDSVMFCFSKGLSAPVGSAICGTVDFISEARQMRTVVGGQMRQVGVIAAAAIVSLERMVDRLREDHANARLLAEGLAQISELEVDLELVQTNIVNFSIKEETIGASEFLKALHASGVAMCQIGVGLIRAVTHRGIDAEDIAITLTVVRDVLKELG